MSVRSASRKIFNKGLESVLPSPMVHKHLKRMGDKIMVDGRTYELHHNVSVIGFGKAVSGMCRAVQDILNDHIVQGIISIPDGLLDSVRDKSNLIPINDGKVIVYPGAKDNLPDEGSRATTLRIIEMLNTLKEGDLIISLISGGGSALLCAPRSPLSLQDKLSVIKTLGSHGATIEDLNTVRKYFSLVKGGKLAEMAYPAEMLALILSDVIGDPLESIASGPTVQDNTTKEDVTRILQKYNVLDKIPLSALNILETDQQCRNKLLSYKASTDISFDHVHNILVGNNVTAVQAACVEAKLHGYDTFVISHQLCGEAKQIGVLLMELGLSLVKILEGNSHLGWSKEKFYDAHFMDLLRIPVLQTEPQLSSSINALMDSLHIKFTRPKKYDRKKLCFISAGETTVTVCGTGKGGRNQEMVLAAGIHYYNQMSSQYPAQNYRDLRKPRESTNKHFRITFLSAGTDGQDGPTDSAGAVFDSASENFITTNEDLSRAQNSLANNDSNTFLKRSGNLVVTGLTGTNVMDLQILTIEVFGKGMSE